MNFNFDLALLFDFLKWNRYFSATEKLPMSFLKAQVSFTSNSAPIFSAIKHNICFGQKEPTKVQIFETFEWSGQHLSNYSCQSWHIIPLQILSSQMFYCMFLSCHVRVSEWIHTLYFSWMSRNSLLEAGAKSWGEVTATGLEPRTA